MRSVAAHGTQQHMVALHQVFVCLLRTPCLISPSAARESSGGGRENAQMDVLHTESPHGRLNGASSKVLRENGTYLPRSLEIPGTKKNATTGPNGAILTILVRKISRIGQPQRENGDGPKKIS